MTISASSTEERRASRWAWAIFEDLRFHGIKIRTISEGDIGELQIGLMGTMNALQLQEIGRKTRRGQQGVARSGRHTGGCVYGYQIRREVNAGGESIRGLRSINEAEAEVVREIFRRYAAGASPRAIVAALSSLLSMHAAFPDPAAADGTLRPSTATPRAETV